MKRDIGHRPSQRIEELAAPLLGFLATDDERLRRFFALTGFDPGSLRAASRSSGFAEALFSYLGSDEPLLLAFAAEQALDPAEVAALAQAAAAPPDDGWGAKPWSMAEKAGSRR